jgi:hypothetical protein
VPGNWHAGFGRAAWGNAPGISPGNTPHADSHWADGGPTTLSNTALVCPAHHHTAHHTGWQARIAQDGLPEWIPPVHTDPQQRPRRHHRHKPPPAPPTE